MQIIEYLILLITINSISLAYISICIYICIYICISICILYITKCTLTLKWWNIYLNLLTITTTQCSKKGKAVKFMSCSFISLARLFIVLIQQYKNHLRTIN